MPSLRALILALLPTVLVIGALDRPRLGSIAVVVDAALVLAILIDVRRAAALPIRAKRRWPPLLVQGAASPVDLGLSSAGPRDLTVEVREALHPALAIAPLRQRLRIPAGGSLQWRYEITPRRRGEHRAGPLRARVLGPWGLGWSRRELLPAESLRVYPRVRWEGRVGRLLRLAQRHELGRSPLRSAGLGRETYALREYRPGDPPGRIHWKATARHGRLVSREDSWERGAPLVVLLDCGRAMASVDGGLSKLDHALAASLALARVASSRGDRVTLIAFSDRVERSVRMRPSAKGVAHAHARLFDLQARLVEPAFDLAADAVRGLATRRATVVMLSSVVDLAAAERLSDAALGLARRHRAILVNLEDEAFSTLALGVPEDAARAFAKTAALGILLANRRLARRLRRAGLRVASAPARRLAWETLDAYLETRPGAAAARHPTAGRTLDGRAV